MNILSYYNYVHKVSYLPQNHRFAPQTWISRFPAPEKRKEKLGKYFEKKRHNKEENVTFWQENIFTQAAGTKTRIMGHTYFIKEGHREEKEMFRGKSTDLPVINVQ